MDYTLLEDTMIQYLLETLRRQKGMSYDDIAGQVYGTENMQRSRLRLYHLRKPMVGGSRKKLSLEDYVRICYALQESPAELLGYLLGKVTREEQKVSEEIFKN